MQNPLASISDIEGLVSRRDVGINDPIQLAAVRELDQTERKEQAERDWEERLEADSNIENKTEQLVLHICDAFQCAKNARQCNGIDEKILTGRRLKAGEYTSAEQMKLEGVDAWFPLTHTMTRIAVAFLRSILADDPQTPLWDLKANRLPQLPEDVVRQAAKLAAQKLQQEFLESGVDISEEQLQEKIEQLRTALFDVLDKQADLRIRNLKRKLQSNLEIANWDEVLDNFLQDLVCDPIACIKGPVVASKPIKEWKEGDLTWPKRRYQHFENVPADHLYPSADSTDAHNGVYIIHLNRMTRHDLNCAKKLKGFVAENIEILLCDFEHKCRDWLSSIEPQMEELEDRVGTWRQDEHIDVIEYHGQLSGRLLKLADIDTYMGREINEKDSYEYEIWIVDKHIIRAQPAVNPDKRPFHIASMYPKCGAFWGDGLPHIAEDLQRTANAYFRASIVNAGYAAGPYFEYDIGLQDQKTGSVPDRMHPGLVLKKNSLTNPNRGAAKIMEAHTVQTQAPLFLQMVDQMFLQAELMTGISRQMLGQAQPGVSTLGESRILESNSATGLQSILVNIDKKVIEPAIEMAACQIMMTTDDPALKADARVMAQGSRNLLTKQLNKDRKLQVLNTILPFYQQQPSIIEPTGLAFLLRRIMEDLGEDPDKLIMDPVRVEQEQLELQLAIAQQSGGGGGVAGGVAQAPGAPTLGGGEPSAGAPGSDGLV